MMPQTWLTKDHADNEVESTLTEDNGENYCATSRFNRKGEIVCEGRQGEGHP